MFIGYLYVFGNVYGYILKQFVDGSLQYFLLLNFMSDIYIDIYIDFRYQPFILYIVFTYFLLFGTTSFYHSLRFLSVENLFNFI